jgi:hypothetical protein
LDVVVGSQERLAGSRAFAVATERGVGAALDEEGKASAGGPLEAYADAYTACCPSWVAAPSAASDSPRTAAACSATADSSAAALSPSPCYSRSF